MATLVSTQSHGIDSNIEANEDLYAIFKALQRQEEFLDIQVLFLSFSKINMTHKHKSIK